MVYSLNFHPQPTPSRTGGQSSSGSMTVFARVVEVILDSSDPSSIGAIHYRVLGQGIFRESPSPLPIAYPGQGPIQRLPLKDEIVVLEILPDPGLTNSDSSTKVYYTRIVYMWNHPSYNGSPNVDQPGTVDKLGRGVVEPSTVNPLRPFQGDTLIEGRLGQSIRFTGFKTELDNGVNINPFADDENNGKPLIIISNDQILTDNGFDRIVEDINEDSASIYLTSDHTIPLTQANTKRSSYKERIPENFNSYRGSQVLLNADRLVFNSRANHILLSSAESVGVNGTSINLDSNKYIALDAPRIYLGSNSFKEEQPVLLGNETVKQLTELIDSLIDYFTPLLKTATGEPILTPKRRVVITKLNDIRTKLGSIKSTKIWVE